MNGFHIETTYDEWKASPFWQKGVQCQDCHMRTVEEAQKVAETLQPVVLKGPSAAAGTERPIYRHFFVGGNANADILAGGKTHAQMAEACLRSAARLEIKVLADASPGRSYPWTCWSTTWRRTQYPFCGYGTAPYVGRDGDPRRRRQDPAPKSGIGRPRRSGSRGHCLRGHRR